MQSQGTSSNCSTPCSGNSAQICGGTNANVLYSFAPLSVPTSTCSDTSCYISLGCFAEPSCTGGKRGMSASLTLKAICIKVPGYNKKVCATPSSVGSVSACADLAKASNYMYFSLQGGNTCYGSNSTAIAVSAGLSTACTTTCSGGSSSTCGGTCANALYQVGEKGEREGGRKGGGNRATCSQLAVPVRRSTMVTRRQRRRRSQPRQPSRAVPPSLA